MAPGLPSGRGVPFGIFAITAVSVDATPPGPSELEKSSSAPGTSPPTGKPKSRGPSGSFRMYAAGLAVAIILMIAAGLVLDEYYHHSSSSSSDEKVLAAVGWAAPSLGVYQFADIPFAVSSPENLTGSFITSNTITVYVMNDSDFNYLVNKNVILGYAYTTGQVWNGNITFTVPTGNWNLVFFDSNKYGSSGVSVIQAVVLTPA